MTSRSEGGEGVSNFVTECDRRGGGGKCQCDVTLRYTYLLNLWSSFVLHCFEKDLVKRGWSLKGMVHEGDGP